MGFFHYLELLDLGPVLWIQFHVSKSQNVKGGAPSVDEHNTKKYPIT